MARVLLFGRLRDVAGWRERASIRRRRRLARAQGAARRRGSRRLGEALDAPGVQAAVDRVLVARRRGARAPDCRGRLHAADERRMIRADRPRRSTRAPSSTPSARAARETGAVASFVGLARGAADGGRRWSWRPIPASPRPRSSAIGRRRHARFGLHDVAIVHRVGAIAPGEADRAGADRRRATAARRSRPATT